MTIIKNILICMMIFLQAQGAANRFPILDHIELDSAAFSALKLDMQTSTDIQKYLTSVLQVGAEIATLLEAQNVYLNFLAKECPEVDRALPLQCNEEAGLAKLQESENPVVLHLNTLAHSYKKDAYDINFIFGILTTFVGAHWTDSWSDDSHAVCLQPSFSCDCVSDVFTHLEQRFKTYQSLEEKQKESFAALHTLMTKTFGTTVPLVFKNTMVRLRMYCEGVDERKRLMQEVLKALQKLCQVRTVSVLSPFMQRENDLYICEMEILGILECLAETTKKTKQIPPRLLGLKSVKQYTAMLNDITEQTYYRAVQCRDVVDRCAKLCVQPEELRRANDEVFSSNKLESVLQRLQKQTEEYAILQKNQKEVINTEGADYDAVLGEGDKVRNYLRIDFLHALKFNFPKFLKQAKDFKLMRRLSI
ncbi:MAG: hypothetical protein OXC30_02730 [Alphaproteobacteria bacterium]|nr:hypothetical protein [Alphaproteobacteria bacterium]